MPDMPVRLMLGKLTGQNVNLLGQLHPKLPDLQVAITLHDRTPGRPMPKHRVELAPSRDDPSSSRLPVSIPIIVTAVRKTEFSPYVVEHILEEATHAPVICNSLPIFNNDRIGR